MKIPKEFSFTFNIFVGVNKAEHESSRYFAITLHLYFTGLFNISDKVLVSLDILLEFREFFKKGHPIGNVVIRAKLLTLSAKCKKVSYIKNFIKP